MCESMSACEQMRRTSKLRLVCAEQVGGEGRSSPSGSRQATTSFVAGIAISPGPMVGGESLIRKLARHGMCHSYSRGTQIGRPCECVRESVWVQ